MKNFRGWGIKNKYYPEFNYRSIWYNLQTIRLGFEPSKELPPDKSEFYDIAINNKCNLGCSFCYSGSSSTGINYSNICSKVIELFGNRDDEDKPYQCAIGSTGEPTIHPDFPEFIKTIFDLDIVPNYTTNGLVICENSKQSEKILDYTDRFCAGVAISANSFIENAWKKAIEKLLDIDVFINLHFIIRDIESVNKFFEIYNEFNEKIHTFVLLPLMNFGRSNDKMDQAAFDYLVYKWPDIENKSNIAFGAHFYDLLKKQNIIKVYDYPPESFSKNLILDDSSIKITPSSFDTKTILWEKKLK